jgi:F420-0:gamma-glutamyl ligase
MNVLFAIIDYDIITDLLPRNIYNSSNYSRKKIQKIIRTHLIILGDTVCFKNRTRTLNLTICMYWNRLPSAVHAGGFLMKEGRR